MRRIVANGTRVTIGSNAVPSALNEGPETTANFLLALDDALALGRGCRFVANGTHYSINRFNEVNREADTLAPQWNPKGTAITWDSTDGSGTGIATGLYSMAGPFGTGPTHYGVIRDEDGQIWWVQNPTRRH